MPRRTVGPKGDVVERHSAARRATAAPPTTQGGVKRIEVSIVGVAPGMLHHRFPEAIMAGLVNPVKLTGRKNLNAEDEAEAAAYRMEDGRLCQPAEHVYAAMVKAGTAFMIQGRGKTTYRDAVKGGLLVEPDPLIPLLTPAGKPIMSYLIDARPARVQRARVMRHRPLIQTWRLDLTLIILDEETFPATVANAILVKAGQTVGIGDYRPRFGRFTVTKWKED